MHFQKRVKVILAAADTFRAAAIEQLEIWADRSKCEIIKQKEGSDPAAVIYDAISAAKARHADVIICDTAGRLHNKKHLMDELAKINRVIDRELPDASKKSFLFLMRQQVKMRLIRLSSSDRQPELRVLFLQSLTALQKAV